MTPKQQRFVEEYLIDLNATQAAIRTGYSARTAYSQGQRLLKNVGITMSVVLGQAQAAKRNEVTVDSIARQLDFDRALAYAERSPSAAVAATMGKAKLFGLITDKVEAKVEHDIPSVTTQAEARAEVEEIFGVAAKPSLLH